MRKAARPRLPAPEAFALQLRAAKVPPHQREYRFHPIRRWRFDFAFIERKIAVEIEGTTYFGKNRDGSMRLGRHQTAKGYASDCAKYNEALLMGWQVLRFPQSQVHSGEALDLTLRLLGDRP